MAQTPGTEARQSQQSSDGLVVCDREIGQLQMAVGWGDADDGEVWVETARLAEGAYGLVVVRSTATPRNADLRRELKTAFWASSTTQEAAVRLFGVVDRQFACSHAFAGLWEQPKHSLAFFAAGFEAPSVLNVGWPHLAELSIQRQALPDGQAMSFGVHCLAPGERWLLYTRPLVEVPTPRLQPFNAVGLIQYAHDDRGMELGLWVDYLLQRARWAHGAELPAGSLLLSLAWDPQAREDRTVQKASGRPKAHATSVSPASVATAAAARRDGLRGVVP